MMKRWLAVLLICTSPLVSAAAYADDKATVDQAKSILAEADQLFLQRDFDHARLKYATAYGLVPSVDILWSLAICEYESGRFADALWRFRQYVRDPKARPWRVEEAKREYIPASARKSGQLDVTAVAGATVMVDGVFRAGSAPLPDPIPVSPGRHRVEARAADGAAVTTDIEVPTGTTVRVKLVSGQVSASAPFAQAAMATPQVAQPASDNASASSPGSAGSAVSPPPAHEAPATEPSSSPGFWNTRTAIGVGMGGAALVAVGVGAYFAVQSSNASDDAQRITGGKQFACNSGTSSSLCNELRDAKDRHDSSQTAMAISFAAGGALAIGSLVTLLVIKDPAPTASSWWFAPTVTASTTGAQLGAKF